MSSVRKLKKEIENQIFEVISDCLLFNGMHPEEKPEEISDIIEEAVALRNDLVSRINNPEKTGDQKERRLMYKKINEDLASGVNKLCKRLSSVSSKVRK